jgi:hypothetical protein
VRVAQTRLLTAVDIASITLLGCGPSGDGGGSGTGGSSSAHGVTAGHAPGKPDIGWPFLKKFHPAVIA